MWSDEDLRWLRSAFFPLYLKGQFVEGWIPFKALYDGKQVVINPSTADIAKLAVKGEYIEDHYKVRIRWQVGYDKYPFTEEIGGRVDALSARLGKRLADLHVYEDPPNFLCDSGPRDLNRAFTDAFNLEKYLLQFLIPRLYAQSYYEKYEKWPWGELSHHFLGLFEWFARAANITREDLVGTARDIVKLTGEKMLFYLVSKKYGGNHRCVCPSGDKLKDCHSDVMKGIRRMRETEKRYGLTLPQLIIEARTCS